MEGKRSNNRLKSKIWFRLLLILAALSGCIQVKSVNHDQVSKLLEINVIPSTAQITQINSLTLIKATLTVSSVPKVKLLSQSVFCRGPGTFCQLYNYTELVVIGRNQDGTWLVVTLGDNSFTCNAWIATSNIKANLDIMALPVFPGFPVLNPCPTPVPIEMLTLVPPIASTVMTAPTIVPTAASTLTGTINQVVAARDGWVDTGVVVKEGQKLSITYLSGQWSACTPPYGCPYTDANGDQLQGGSKNASLNYVDNVISGCYHGALIARIGANYPFCVGTSYSSIIQDSGDLLLSINDRVLSDDGGKITVQIVITGPTSTPTFTSEPKIKILTPAFIRSGPGTVYGILTSYKNGTELTVIGRNQDGTWLEVTLPDNRYGWIATILIETNLDVLTLPIIQAPPTPTPYSTPAPTQNQSSYPIGDINHDCVVDGADYEILHTAFGSKIGDPNYNPAADLNSDGAIDIYDYNILVSHYGEKCY